MAIKVGVIIPDLHYPYNNKQYTKLLMKLVGDLKPNYLIYGGDCFDAYGISKYAKQDGLDEEQGVYDTHKEIIGFKENIYDPLKTLSHKNVEIHWAGGNHDLARTEEMIKKMPERAGLLDVRKIFPDANICSYNKFIHIGNAHFTHGIYTNDAHAKKHVTACESNIFYFHCHTIQEYTKITVGENRVHSGKSLGCGCDLNPDYLKHRPTGWVLAISVIYFFPNGDYNEYTIKVINGQFIFEGKLYK